MGTRRLENRAEAANGVSAPLSWLARWHQKTTRGATQYWLKKGEDTAETPSLLRNDFIKDIGVAGADEAPLAPLVVPDTPATPADVSEVLFSEGEEQPGVITPGGTPGTTPGLRIRKRVRIMEETVRMYPHEELYDSNLEQSQNKTLVLWRQILLLVVLLVIPLVVYAGLGWLGHINIKSPTHSTTES